MYAIVEISGKQVKIEKDQFIYTDRLAGDINSVVEFGNVLLVGNGDKTNIGGPFIKGASVSGKILAHVQDDKVISFKKKRRKGFRKKIGHRAQLTKVLIDKITI